MFAFLQTIHHRLRYIESLITLRRGGVIRSGDPGLCGTLILVFCPGSCDNHTRPDTPLLLSGRN